MSNLISTDGSVDMGESEVNEDMSGDDMGESEVNEDMSGDGRTEEHVARAAQFPQLNFEGI